MPEDTYLQALVRMADLIGFGTNLTLTVGGIVVEGTLISEEVYLELGPKLLEDAINDPEARAQVSEATVAQMDVLAEEVSGRPTKEEASPRYIHLRDVRIYCPGLDAMPFLHQSWRGRLESVDGFSIGTVATVEDE